ncbi:hypothetical protein P280DRAFT_550121 [Massarina eburnea CBS 473.64]|uniref:Uncharacterized protein n=1 Tax=Massarina eburnea CBS 473.64 TaxID=1395130 RepID=A0A6A6RXQ7_9PLEO|nr:hypothetical protein P280DRAFT_550121 [Massarina eburnea CBS 473.64]
MSTSDPSVPSPDGTCHLLRIPGELRNRIYKYALTEPHGIGYVEDNSSESRLVCLTKIKTEDTRTINRNIVMIERTSFLRKHPVRQVVANQIQFVNRAFRQETRGLGLKFNVITFFPTLENYAIGVLARFLATCPSEKKDWLRAIVVDRFKQGTSSKSRLKSDQNVIFDFCRTHDKVKVELPVVTLQKNHDNIFLETCAVMRLLRNEDHLVSKLPYISYYHLSIHQFMDTSYTKLIKKIFVGDVPRNVQLYPWGIFDEEYIRIGFHFSGYGGIKAQAGNDDWESAWIKALREVWENGF